MRSAIGSSFIIIALGGCAQPPSSAASGATIAPATSNAPALGDASARLQRRLRIDFPGAALRDVIDFIRDATGLRFSVASKVDVTTRVEVLLNDVTAASALTTILARCEPPLEWKLANERIEIAPKKEPPPQPGELFLEIYDVQDVVDETPDYPAPGTRLVLTDFERDDDRRAAPSGVVDADKLIALVESKLGDQNVERTSIEFHRGQLIVNQTREGHARVARLLAALRAIPKSSR